MFHILGTGLGIFLLAGSLASAIVDAYESFNTRHLVSKSLSIFFQAFIPSQYDNFLGILSARFSPNLAHLFENVLKLVPIFLVMGASGVFLLTLSAKPKWKIGFSNR